MHSSTIKVAQFGLGPIGIASLRQLTKTPWAEVVGGVDIDPEKQGKAVSEVASDPALGDGKVYPSFESLLAEVKPDVVLHTASSNCAASIEQILPMASAGVHVSSTCEPLLFPWLTEPELAERLDAAAQEGGAAVVGTGVNPGFVMDLLPVLLTAVMGRVTKVYAERVVDATTRRGPLQKKVGSGLSPEAFLELFKQRKAGHAGFRESAALIADSLGWPVDPEAIVETLEPVVATESIQTPHVKVEPGQTRGLHQIVTMKHDGEERLRLDLTMALKEPEPRDIVRLEGDPPLEVRFPTGLPGDGATVASLINAVPRLFTTAPGLKKMTDLGAPKHGWRPGA